MEFYIKKNVNNQLDNNKVNIKVEVSSNNKEIDKFIEYIKKYEREEVYANIGNELKSVKLDDILYFYSDKKHNYCKTLSGTFRVKSKLYELEKNNLDFFRISKSCVINISQVKCFDLGETGKIIVRFYDDSEQIVSRRKIKDIKNYLDERGI